MGTSHIPLLLGGSDDREICQCWDCGLPQKRNRKKLQHLLLLSLCVQNKFYYSWIESSFKSFVLLFISLFFLPQTNQSHWKSSFFDLEHSVTMWDVLVGEGRGMLTLQVTKNKMQAAVGCRLLCPLRVKLLGLA